MNYVSRDQVTDLIPLKDLTDALDDDGDQVEDAGAFDSLVATQCLMVDGFLSGLFLTPLANPPAKVKTATLIFVLEAIYQRRRVPDDKNPWKKQADWWREHLQKVGNRELPFDAGTPKAFSSGIVTEECLATKGSSL